MTVIQAMDNITGINILELFEILLKLNLYPQTTVYMFNLPKGNIPKDLEKLINLLPATPGISL